MKRYCGERGTKITKGGHFVLSVFRNLVYLKTSKEGLCKRRKEMNFTVWFSTLTRGTIKILTINRVSKITLDIYKRFYKPLLRVVIIGG